jgi:flavin-dependent dehydrogenase
MSGAIIVGAGPGIGSAVARRVAPAGVRALTELLDRAYGPRGLHVATVTVAGAVAPGGPYDPDEIAEHYWRLHQQPPARWEREVLHAARPE